MLRVTLAATALVVLAGSLLPPRAAAHHTAGGEIGGRLLPDLRTKEPEGLSISNTSGLVAIDPSPSGFPTVGGSRQTWSRAANLVTGNLVYHAASLGTMRGCTDSAGTSPWVGTPHAGEIVLMDRGICAVSMKVHNAAAAGAVAAIVGNNVLQSSGESPPNFSYGGGAQASSIAGYSITLRDANRLKGLPETTAANTAPGSPNALDTPATIDPSVSFGERRLLLDNEVGNAHSGPLELWAGGSDTDCDGNGLVAAGERAAYQRLYEDASSNDGAFVRGVDTIYTDVQVGCFAYHPEHGHTHFDAFATYELRRYLDGSLVASSEKVTFCIADVWRVVGSLPGSPAAGFYTSCGGLMQGLSVGWSDEYPYTVSGQHIVLNPGGTYVGDGSYCLVSHADPTAILREDNAAGNAEGNNAASVQITLSNSGATVQSFPGTSCGGIGPESWTDSSPPPPADETPPTITAVSPADGASNVSASTNVSVTFSEAMNAASTQTAFSLSGSGSPVGGTFSWSGNTMTFDPSGSLAGGATYTATVSTGATDAAGNPLGAARVWSFSIAPPATSVTAYPGSATIQSGSRRSGGVGSLAANDNSFFEVYSTTSGTSAWYGRFTGVANSLTSLKVSYSGKNSLSCTQTLAFWNWTSGLWVQVDARTVGTTEVLVSNRSPGGTLAEYVSGTSGNGDVAVRVRCTRSSSFYASGDLLELVFTRPA